MVGWASDDHWGAGGVGKHRGSARAWSLGHGGRGLKRLCRPRAGARGVGATGSGSLEAEAGSSAAGPTDPMVLQGPRERRGQVGSDVGSAHACTSREAPGGEVS